jgi:hypothetical protein
VEEDSGPAGRPSVIAHGGAVPREANRHSAVVSGAAWFRVSVRIATFNILSGRSPEDGQVDEDRFRAAVRRLDADLLGLQEVDRNQPRSGHADLTVIAAEVMGTSRPAPRRTGSPSSAAIRSWAGGRFDCRPRPS